MQSITIVLVNRIVPHKQMNKSDEDKFLKQLKDAEICQLNLLRSCFASQSGQQKCV